MIKYEDLTPKAQEDYQSLIKDKMNAFDLLTANYNSEQGTDIDSNKIVTRLQSQYVVANSDEKSLRLSKEWFQNEFYQPNSVNVDVAAVTSGKYSSFALLKANDNLKTDFPLDDDYAKEGEVFNDQIYSDASFAIELARLKDKLGLDIKQNKIIKTTTYKHNLVNKAIIKVQNLALRIFKKPLKISGLFSGKMELKTRYSNQYTISNIEKLAKVYDTILGVATKNEAKNYKKKLGKKSKEITFASQLFADVLMSRVCDLKSKNNNKKLEACYWLQFANTLNRYGFSAEQLKLITEIGTKATANLCKQLGITTDEIVFKMQKLGYAYNVVPADEFQALLCVKQKDYEMYKGGYEEVKDETSKQADEELNIAKGVEDNDETILKEEDDNKTEDSKTNNLNGEEVNETEENNTASEQSDKKENVSNEDLNEVNSDEKVVTAEQTTDSTDEQPVEEDTTEIQSLEAEGNDNLVSFKEEGKRIRRSTAEKVIDKSIVKYLAEQSTKLAEKINQGKFKGKKLQVATAEQRLTNLILSYYVQTINAKPMSVKNDETYNENEITKAKIIVKGICLKREKLVNEVVNRDKAVDQKASSFVNAVSKEIYKQTARDYFVGKIKDCIVLCLYGDFKINKNKTKSEEDAIKLLESGKRLLEASKEENATDDDNQKTMTEEDHDNYVPNFVIMDDKENNDKEDTEAEQKKYVPNFVIVDNNDDFTK